MRAPSDNSIEERPSKRTRIERANEEDGIVNQIGRQSGFDQCSVDHAEETRERSESTCITLAPTLKAQQKNDFCLERCTDIDMQSKHLYLYQRQEYDEGMYVYKALAPVQGALPDVLRDASILYNNGQACIEQGNFTEAGSCFKVSMQRLTSVRKLANKESLLVRIHHNLGYCYYRLGDNEESMACFKAALKLARQQKLEEVEHAAIINSIGVLYFHQKDSSCWEEAREIFETTLAVFQRHLDQDSPRIATLLNNIGRVHYLKGEYKEALGFYERALVIRRKKLGNNSIDVAATICNAGQTHHQLGELDKAMDYYQLFLQIASKHLGSSHRDISIVMKCMAEIHHERQELEKAREMYEGALTRAFESLGAFHPEVASNLNRLGNLFYEMNDHDRALEYYMKGFKVEQIVFDFCHPHILVTLMNIAQIHRQRGDFLGALQYYIEVRTRTVQAMGPQSIETANSLLNIALMHYQLKALDAALENYREALQIQRRHYGSDENIDVASSLNSIGLVLYNQDRHEMAKQCFFESLRIRQKILGSDHLDVAILCYNIATIYLEAGEDELAIEYYKQTLRVERVALGHDHQDVVLTLQHLGLVYQQRGELEEALIYFGEACEIESSKSGVDSQQAVARLLNLMGNIHLQRANVSEMMTCYARAARIYSENGQPGDGIVIAGYNFYGLSKLHPPGAPTA